MATTPAPAAFEFMSYAEFGAAFFDHAISAERITAGFADMNGQESTIGPIPADPLGLVKVLAKTRIGMPAIERKRSDNVTYAIAIPIDLELTIDVAPSRPKLTLGGLLPDIDILGGRIDPSQKLNYRGDVVVNLTLTARAAKPLRVVIDIERPTSKAVTVDIKADGLLAKLLQQGGVLEREIKKAVAKEVRDQLASPSLQGELVVDIAARMDSDS